MKRCFYAASILIVAVGLCGVVRAAGQEFLCGVDVTMLTKVEEAGGTFSLRGQKQDALQILKDKGVNAIRLRLFVSPDGKGPLVCDLNYVLALSQRVKKAGLKLLLNLHYSDTWADPGHQTKPQAWESLDFPGLLVQVKFYTQQSVGRLIAGNASPDYIQIGNETNMGMLWPEGKTVDEEGWKRYVALVKAGMDGARAAYGSRPAARFIHHVADPKYVVWHMNNFFKYGGETDLIGISWYPVGTGNFADLKKKLAEIASLYDKDIVIAETDYPWTTQAFDSYPNVLGGKPAVAGMPAYSPQGQAEFLRQLIATLKGVPGGHGAGFFYWEGTWLPSGRFGSPTDNTNLFDNKGEALPALDSLSSAAR